MSSESTPPPVASPVVVTPIQANESRTLRLAWLTTLWTAVLAVLPDIVGFIINLWASDPTFAKAVIELVPLQYRVIFGVILVAIVQRFAQLRRVTIAPIAGTSAALYAKRASS